MALKPDGQQWVVREQIVEDPVSGLIFQFELVPGTSAPFRLRVFGQLPLGNREIIFDHDGQEAGAGIALTGSCRPTWLTEIDA